MDELLAGSEECAAAANSWPTEAGRGSFLRRTGVKSIFDGSLSELSRKS